MEPHKKKFTSWSKFDPEEYTRQNYGQAVLHEDEQIISTFISHANAANIPLENFRKVIDIGAGPNLYPGMLLTPYCSKDVDFTLSDYSIANVSYLSQLKLDTRMARYTWAKFEDLMIERGGEKYSDSLNKLLNWASVRHGNIYNLNKYQYDAVISFFVTESITNSMEGFCHATRATIEALSSRGYLVAAHMLGSKGYSAGEKTKFPAVNLSEKDLYETYSEFKESATFKIFTFSHGNDRAARTGYEGMALVILRKS